MYRCCLCELFTDDPGKVVEFYLDAPFDEAWKQLGDMMSDSSFTRATMWNDADEIVYDCVDDNGIVKGVFGALEPSDGFLL